MEILNFKFSLLFTKMWNHRTIFVFNNGGLCLQNSLSVRWHGFYLLWGLCISRIQNMEYSFFSVRFFSNLYKRHFSLI